MDTSTEARKELIGWRHLSAVHKAGLIWFAVSIFLLIIGACTGRSFFVSPACFHVFLWPALIFSIAITADFMSLGAVMSTEPSNVGESIKKMHPLMKFALTPAATFCILGYIPLAICLPALLHHMNAKPYQATYAVSETELESSRGSHCNHVYIKELENYSFGKLCVSNMALQALKPGSQIRLEGMQSWFGMTMVQYGYRTKSSSMPSAEQVEHVKT